MDVVIQKVLDLPGFDLNYALLFRAKILKLFTDPRTRFNSLFYNIQLDMLH